MVRRQITDSDDNGEVIRQYGYGINDNVVMFNHDKSFIKIFTNQLKKYKNRISTTEMIIIFDLLHYVTYESGMLSKVSRNDDRYPIFNNDISIITGFSKKIVTKSMAHLVSIGIFGRSKVGKNYMYFANPYIFCKGVRINKTLIDMFKQFK